MRILNGRFLGNSLGFLTFCLILMGRAQLIKVACFKAILFYIRVFKTLSYNAWYIICFLNDITDHMTDNALTVSAQRLAYFYYLLCTVL
jgi:hypothetical protein